MSYQNTVYNFMKEGVWYSRVDLEKDLKDSCIEYGKAFDHTLYRLVKIQKLEQKPFISTITRHLANGKSFPKIEKYNLYRKIVKEVQKDVKQKSAGRRIQVF